MTLRDKIKFRQLLVDLKEISYQSGDVLDRQGEYISDNLNHVIKRLEELDERYH